jgi:hypothetical protein
MYGRGVRPMALNYKRNSVTELRTYGSTYDQGF